MARNNETDEIDSEYSPVYEFDADEGLTGEVKITAPKADQQRALLSIANEGPTEPDGWFEGYDGAKLPVIDGVPVPMLNRGNLVASKSEGRESMTRHAVEGVGHVEVSRSFGHPENSSWVKVASREDL